MLLRLEMDAGVGNQTLFVGLLNGFFPILRTVAILSCMERDALD